MFPGIEVSDLKLQIMAKANSSLLSPLHSSSARNGDTLVLFNERISLDLMVCSSILSSIDSQRFSSCLLMGEFIDLTRSLSPLSVERNCAGLAFNL